MAMCKRDVLLGKQFSHWVPRNHLMDIAIQKWECKRIQSVFAVTVFTKEQM